MFLAKCYLHILASKHVINTAERRKGNEEAVGLRRHKQHLHHGRNWTTVQTGNTLGQGEAIEVGWKRPAMLA